MLAVIRFLAALGMVVALAAPTAGQAQPATAYTRPQLEQMLAPVALYPDPLLGQILMAATYPLEVVAAARWLQDPNNASLTGDQLALAAQALPWEPSVKSLLPFPQILQRMNSELDWMQQLGDAFLAQQTEVMDAVQRLRAQARAAGRLYSTPEAVVSSDGTVTSIEPANPQFVYVPSYDPTTIYGDWPYPELPPYAFSPYPGYGWALGGGMSFGVAVGVVVPLWGWGHFDWRQHRIRIDDRRHKAINRDAIVRDGRPPVKAATWEHDPFHRRGVAYRDERSRQRFLASPGGSAERPKRSLDSAPAAVLPPPRVDPSAPRTPTARPPGTDPGRERRPPPHTASPPPPAAPASAVRPPEPVRHQQPTAPTPHRASPAGDGERGRDVSRDGQRGHAGHESRAPQSSPAPMAPAVAPRQGDASRAAPAGGEGRREH